jgi:hypothetical protein
MTTSPTLDPGRAAALVDGLVADLAGADVPASLAAHRALRRGPLAAGLGPLVVPVSGMAGLLDALDTDRISEPVDLVLVADRGLVEAAEARAVLLDDDRVALVRLHITLPTDGPLSDSARLTLDSLDFALPAAVGIPAARGWEAALDVLAEDGAEQALLTLSSRGPSAEHVAEFVVACVRRGVSFAVVGAAASAYPGLLAATATALEGRDAGQVAAVLLADDLTLALAVLADCDPRAVRRRLTSIASVDAGSTLAHLVTLGLLTETEA